MLRHFLARFKPTTPRVINRMAVTLKPKAPYVVWVNKLPRLPYKIGDDFELVPTAENDGLKPSITLKEARRHNRNTYIIPGMELEAKAEEWVLARASLFWHQELSYWTEDTDLFPPCTLQNFNEWFDIEVSLDVIEVE